MRADEQESDMRRDTRGRGCTRTGSPVVIIYGVLRKSGGYAWKVTGITPGDPTHVHKGLSDPQGKPNVCRKSAEGILADGNEPGGVTAPYKRRNRRTQHGEGLNGGRGRMTPQNVRITMKAGKYEINADANGAGKGG